jgi:hypothetical protein
MKKTASIALACIASLVLFGTSANAANLILNGGFEDPELSTTVGIRSSDPKNDWNYFTPDDVLGWDGYNIEIWNSANMGTVGYEGVQHAELNSHPAGAYNLYQGFATEVGQIYQISFAYMARVNDQEEFEVGIVNDITDFGVSSVFSETLNDHVTGQWSTFTGTFEALSDYSYIYFRALIPDSTTGNFIDDVAVSAVPVPAAVWLFSSALVGLVGFGRRNGK